jgi:iron complex outermembrane recepter protein
MRMRSFVLLLLSFLLINISVNAQAKRTVTGLVRDANGAALAGATVNEKGTTNNVLTGDNGAFSISVADNGRIVVSFAGFTAQELAVPADGNLSVTLQNNGTTLNEVVVTGFGVRRQTKKLSYSVQEVKGEDLARANSPSLVNALQGKVAGVMINQGAGGPSSSSRIRIRGNASISRSNTQPLFVVDGVLIKPGTSGADSWGDARDFGNELKNLNPDDYESVTVLKGSAATALYGSDALFGVVLITTKKGRDRKGLGVTVAHSSTFEKAYRLPDFQNEYGGGIAPAFIKGTDGVNEVEPNFGPYYSFGPKFDGQMVRDVDGRMIPWRGNDILDLFRTGQFYNTNVALEGGSDKTTVRFSYTNTKNNSIMPNNAFGRNVFTLRATQKLNKAINMDAVVTYATSTSKNPLLQGGNSNPIFRLGYSNSRHYDINYYKDLYIDTIRGGRTGASGNPNTNPYTRGGMSSVFWNFYQKNITQREDNLRANLDLNIDVLPWLHALLRGNINSVNINRENQERGELPGFLGGYYALYQSSNKYGRLQGLLTATKTFGQDFDGSLTVGGETNRGISGYENNATTNGGFKIADIYALSNSVNTINANGRRFPQSRLDATYAYGDLTWKERLTLNFSARNDWNSTLTYPSGTGDYGYFYPSVGLAWIFSESLKNNTAFDFLSFGKLRASLGYSGAGTDIYETSRGAGYGLNGNYIGPDASSTPIFGFRSYDLPNLNLKPERSREYEVGADLRFFEGRLGVDLSWYKKNTFNQIVRLSAPPESGVGSRLINAGNIQNQGIEAILSGTPVRSRDVQWTTTFNFSRNRNKVIDIDAANGVNSLELDLAFGADVKSVARVGKEYGTIITGYAFATYQAKDASGNPIASPSNGQRILKQDGVYMRSSEAGQGEKELGSMMEKFLLSNSNEVRYKNLSLFVQVDSKFGGLMASATHQYGTNYGSFESTLFGRDAARGGIQFTDANGVTRNDGIIPEGVFADGTKLGGVDVGGMSFAEAAKQGLIKPMAAWQYYEGIGSWGTGIREYSVFENSWVALREVSLGYNLPQRFSSKLRMNTLRVSAVGRNLGYLYNSSKDNIHPESVFSSRAGAFAEYGGVPYVRSIGVSLNAGF